MSLKTWKEEFYPEAPTKRMTAISAIENSIRKWEGLTRANMDKHGLVKLFDESIIVEEEPKSRAKFLVTASTCALCKKYYNRKAYLNEEEDSACFMCPLYIIKGEQCDDKQSSPYIIWMDTGNPRPMISLLKRALKRELKNANI
jgi:hypothetical protein